MNKKIILATAILSIFTGISRTSNAMEQKDSETRTVSPKKPFPVNRIRTTRNCGMLGRTPQKDRVSLVRGKQLKEKAKQLPSGKKKQRTNEKALVALTYAKEHAAEPVTRIKAAIELDHVEIRKQKKKKETVGDLSLDFSKITIRKNEKPKNESPNKFPHLLNSPHITDRKKRNNQN